MVDARFINLACGPFFIDNDDWANFDFSTTNLSVRRANLLDRLPLPSGKAELVYATHFLEHIPRRDVHNFLFECHRVLMPGGVIRLVMPDLEEMARSYLKLRDSNEHELADFLVVEMVDQCVRRHSGGSWVSYTGLSEPT